MTAAKQRKEKKSTKVAVVKLKKGLVTRRLFIGSLRAVAALFTLGVVLAVVSVQFPVEKLQSDILGSESTASAQPAANSSVTPLKVPEVSAASYLVASLKKGRILFSSNIDLRLPPASTTKMFTALVAIKEFNLAEVVEVPEFCTVVEGAKMGLLPKEVINVESLLYGLLVSSAGDAACTLSTHKFSSASFVLKMNTLAGEIGLSETNFTNSIGLDSDNGSHLSSARDLYLISRVAMQNGIFRKIVGTKEIELSSSDGETKHQLISTNRLLFDIPGSLGIKTGKTEAAKEVLVYSYQYKDDEITVIVMGSEDRFSDTRKLLDFTIKNYGAL